MDTTRLGFPSLKAYRIPVFLMAEIMPAETMPERHGKASAKIDIKLKDDLTPSNPNASADICPGYGKQRKETCTFKPLRKDHKRL
jgi:hypothetical protein